MSGTKDGARKTVESVKAKYGNDFYKQIGQKGGQISRTGGFFGDPERAREAGKKGGATKRENQNASKNRQS